MRKARVGFLVAVSCAAFAACGWDPSHPFDRDAPKVKEATRALDDGGDANTATDLLEDYLSTGKCAEGSIGTPAAVREKHNGSLDLGLALFRVGETFGRRFGEEEIDAGLSPQEAAERSADIDCALKIVQAIAADEKAPLEVRARARYLEGNLHFLAGEYEPAASAYNLALTLAPGMNDAGDPIGRDAAWNRAIAMRRIDDKKDAGQDASPGDSGPPSDGGSDAGNQGDAAGDGGGGGGGNDAGPSGQDSGQDAGAPPPNTQPDSGPPPPSRNQDERTLDDLDKAPTVQEETAKRLGQHHKVHGMADK